MGNFLAILIALATLLPSFAFATATALTPQKISETSYTFNPSAGDNTNGNSVANLNGDVFLIFKGNGTATATISANGATINVTGYGPLTKSDLAVSLTLGDIKIVGPFQSNSWNSSGVINIAYSGTNSTSVTVKAVYLDPVLQH